MSGESYALFHCLFTSSMFDFFSTSIDGRDVLEENSWWRLDFLRQLFIGCWSGVETSGLERVQSAQWLCGVHGRTSSAQAGTRGTRSHRALVVLTRRAEHSAYSTHLTISQSLLLGVDIRLRNEFIELFYLRGNATKAELVRGGRTNDRPTGEEKDTASPSMSLIRDNIGLMKLMVKIS